MNDIVFSSDRGWDGHGWGAPWFGITFLLLLLVIGGVAIYFARRRSAPSGGAGGESEAEQLLTLRFARGDIDEEDYLARLSTLRGGQPDA
ncbi:MAG TPA: hypothetical protein VFR23_01560 [Jiangellaceae bacterium]|nr:hypothetical protein [Jiangellaceae bacterium]